MDIMSEKGVTLNESNTFSKCHNAMLSEDINKIEDDRLKEIILLCQSYNDAQENNNKRIRPMKVIEGNNLLQKKSPDALPLTSERDCRPCEFKVMECNNSNDTSSNASNEETNTEYNEHSNDEYNESNGSDDSNFSSLLNDSDRINASDSSKGSFRPKKCDDPEETLNSLVLERDLIIGEIEEMNKQHYSDEEDEELREFQRIEKEIKLSELQKGLEAIEKDISRLQSECPQVPLVTPEKCCETKENTDQTNIIDTPKHRQRPLTLYLPSPNETLDLVSHVSTLGHDISSFTTLINLLPTTCSGYLWKLCKNTENKWRKRYFHFDRINKVFIYFKRAKNFIQMKKPRYGVYFDEIQDVYVDHNRIKPERIKRKQRHVFVVSTSKRSFVLSTYVAEVMRIWIDVIFTGAEGYLEIE